MIPDEVFKKATVTSVEECLEAAKKIGFPIMLKASEGGGGKGIRMSDNEDELKSNFFQVQNEVRQWLDASRRCVVAKRRRRAARMRESRRLTGGGGVGDGW